MYMALSPYWQTNTYKPQQALIENLIIEAIKIYGVDAYYLPKTINNLDKLIGEDSTLSFDQAASLEMYVKDYQGYNGDGSFLSKFGIEIRQQMTFCFARRRFQEIRRPSYVDENGWEYQLEETDTYLPMNIGNYELEDADVGDFAILTDRPMRGDVIYFPMVKKWFEIKHVRTDEVNYFQLGALQMYEIDTELIEYSGEKFNTGNTDIDAISAFDLSTLSSTYELDNGAVIDNEDGEPITAESFNLAIVDPIEDNDNLREEASDVVDFSQINPFTKVDSNGQW